VIFFPDSPSYQGSIPIFPTSENKKKKGLKLKTLFSFRGTGLIPISGGINHWKTKVDGGSAAPKRGPAPLSDTSPS
jgi:hypothetical protein